MPDNDALTTFQKKLAERRRAAAAVEAAKPREFADDLVPDASDGSERSEEDAAVDNAIASIDIVAAYKRWCGKMQPNVRPGQVEGIMISCPKPGHKDANPSAWINLAKQTWFCGGCNEGGDVYDIAAYNLGYPVPGYKSGAEFHKLRKQMAEDFGYRFVRAPGIDHDIVVAPESEQPRETKPALSVVPDATEDSDEDNVTSLFFTDEKLEFPTLNWRSVVAPDTFLDEYMKATIVDDIPEEYNFWNGLLAVGFAAGQNAALFDRNPVRGNLFVCLLGNTGDGKSRSFSHFKNLIRMALPYRQEDEYSKGCKIVSAPASAESLIHQFSKPIFDPSDPKRIMHYASVRGCIEFNELSSLVGRTNRTGNVLKPTMMEFYDGSPVISSSSLTSGVKQAHDSFASAFTSTQPKALRTLVGQSDADSGFLNRWVFASGKPKQRVAIGGAVVDLTGAIKPLQAIRDWVGIGKTINWHSDAAILFSDFFTDKLHPTQQQDESGMLTRMDLLMKKLIFLIAVNEHSDFITVDIVNKVIGMYDYLLETYSIPAKSVGETIMSLVHSDITKIISIASAKGTAPSVREIVRLLSRKKYQLDMIHKVLKYMTELGEIEARTTTPTSKGGRTTVRYYYVG